MTEPCGVVLAGDPELREAFERMHALAKYKDELSIRWGSEWERIDLLRTLDQMIDRYERETKRADDNAANVMVLSVALAKARGEP